MKDRIGRRSTIALCPGLRLDHGEGARKEQLVQITDARKIYQQEIAVEVWSAIQITTAAGLCAVLDSHVQGALPRRGFVRQEQVNFTEFLENRFGRFYQSQIATRFANNGDERPAD